MKFPKKPVIKNILIISNSLRFYTYYTYKGYYLYRAMCMKMFSRNIIFIFFLSSCSFKANIVESFLFKKTKNCISGKYTITLDLTAARSMVFALKKIEESEDQDLDAFVYNAFHEVAHLISKFSGIEKVTLSYDQKFLRFTLTFEFSDLKSLNRALSIIDRSKESTPIIMIQDGRVVRNLSAIEDIFKYHINEIEDEKDLVRFKLFFKDIKWISIYAFDGYKVRPPTNGHKEISADCKVIGFEHFLVDMEGYKHIIFIS